MKITDNVMEILNNDEKAKELIGLFERAAEGANLTGTEYDEARKTVTMLAISRTPEAMSAMANGMWVEVNAN